MLPLTQLSRRFDARGGGGVHSRLEERRRVDKEARHNATVQTDGSEAGERAHGAGSMRVSARGGHQRSRMLRSRMLRSRSGSRRNRDAEP